MRAPNPDPFYDRGPELAALERAWSRNARGGQMMLLYGRRRLGKTYLLQRFCSVDASGAAAARPHCYFLAEQTTAAAQRMSLARLLLDTLPSEGVTEEEIAVSWNSLLRYATQAAAKAGRGRFALILDEFPYLVAQAPELPSIIQSWWDREGAHSSLFVVLCGSMLSTMEALGAESSPLFGRFNAGIVRLEPLGYRDVAAFYAGSQHYGVAQTLLMYGVLGGTPRYHALVDTERPPATEIVTLLMQPRAILENEVDFLLGSEQIRDPAPYNAVLGAIAAGRTQFGGIQTFIGVERGSLTFYLRTLQTLGWIRREYPFGDRSDRRAIYRVADPFLSFWYRFVASLASELQFSDAHLVYAKRVEPFLADYMGHQVFEEICAQWLRRNASDRLRLTLRSLGRYWSRDGALELDVVGECDDGAHLFGECKWSASSVVGIGEYIRLQAKVRQLPDRTMSDRAAFVLFSVGGFSPELVSIASDPTQRLFLVTGDDFLT